MAFCAQCGAQVEGSFCGRCGSPNPAAGSVAGPKPTAAPASGLTDNMAGALCYALGLLTGIIFLVLEPYNRNKTVRFHAFQSIFLNIAWFVLWTALTALTSAFSIFGLILVPFYGLLMCAGVAGWVYLMYRTANNRPLVVPYIGPLAEQQAQNV